ncbi:PqqD family protein [Amycolatopsis antarctica]|uniref:PqqD family protein n=1 Tax=Amycolatopsis antarctica TaxID=1854586 RepID=A0A263D3H2_9PSEU|nr:lasso peptide biosynthesis PqqD family chaperone [Amycolatopsis antarctica]OZM73022.1 PqqD family protein [Amycolatopsis antarctica]
MSYHLAPDVTVTETGSGLVLLNERDGGYWQMNETGATVLRAVLAGETAESAAATLRAAHPGAAERITTDVEATLDALIAAKLVTA